MSRPDDAWPPFACSSCGARLDGPADRWRCPRSHVELRLAGGIWRSQSSAAEARFLDGYRKVRRAEGWGSEDPAYLRALPFEDLTGRHREIWGIRAASYRLLLRPLPAARQRVVDLGAGNGWLAVRLATAGHRVAAVDLSDDVLDGLGAAVPLPEARSVTWIQSSFDRVPIADGACDLAVFNGSFHYSGEPRRTLAEALRLLAPHGRLAILDSPFYRRAASGQRMLEERRRQWSARGLEGAEPDGDAPPVAFLTRRRLDRWGEALGVRWRTLRLPLGWRWWLAPYLLPLLGRREPARFPLILGTRRGAAIIRP